MASHLLYGKYGPGANSLYTGGLEATHLGGRRWAVRPKGQLGTCGWHPVSWDVIYVEAGTAAEAIRKVLAKRGK